MNHPPSDNRGVHKMIQIFRGIRVMLDSDLARLYGVSTKQLNQQVSRNPERFPDDFMFELGPTETTNLKSHMATTYSGWGGRRRGRPRVFTEQGVAMLSSVLKSRRAIEVNIEIMRAFVRLRRWLLTNEELSRRLDALERRYDGQFRAVFDAIRGLIREPTPARRPIGFKPP